MTATCPRRLLASTHSVDDATYRERGGVDGAIRDIGADAVTFLRQLNAELTA